MSEEIIKKLLIKYNELIDMANGQLNIFTLNKKVANIKEEIEKVTQELNSHIQESGDDAILFTIDCPSCKVLESKLNDKNINYFTFKDNNFFSKVKMDVFPQMYIPGKGILSYRESLSWLKEN